MKNQYKLSTDYERLWKLIMCDIQVPGYSEKYGWNGIYGVSRLNRVISICYDDIVIYTGGKDRARCYRQFLRACKRNNIGFIDPASQQVDAKIQEALIKAKVAMDYLGDKLNGMDAVNSDCNDESATNPLFEFVDEVLNTIPDWKTRFLNELGNAYERSIQTPEK